MKTHRQTSLWVVLLVTLLMTQCGQEAQFEQGILQSNDALPSADRDPASFALNWNLECGAMDSSLALASKQKDDLSWDDDDKFSKASKKKDLPDIAGDGSHQVPMTGADTLALNLTGMVCEPESRPRDIVFVIDTSMSMSRNDRYTQGSCGRSQAVATVLNNIQNPESVRIGLVTFGSGVNVTTGNLLDYEQFVTSMYNSESILCEADGNTNYRAALAQSVAMLTSAQLKSSREVYFISDGEPSTGQSGLQEANTLKNKQGINATIATMMVDGHDASLKSIASVDSYGQPMHAKTDNANDLSDMIQELSESTIIDTTMRYRGIGSLGWTEEDLSHYTSGSQFHYPMENIRLTDYPNGLEIEIEYIDSHARSFFERGQLLWSAK